jgi:ribosomal protein S18 acetylase RimI-like enzyme
MEPIKIVELRKGDASLPILIYRYKTSQYYDLRILREPDSWRMELTLKPLEKVCEKYSESKLFEEHVEEPRAFAAELGGEQIGWIEVGYERWNNRMRVWEFLVREEFRRKGIGTLLMKHAVRLSKEKLARMLVLETQSCDVPAIGFYLRFGFELIGFDAAAYSNEDIAKKEVRLEFGLKIA